MHELINSWREIAKSNNKPVIKPPSPKEFHSKASTLLNKLINNLQISTEIEQELSKLSPTAYASKLRSLKFNLSKNQSIRERVASGVMTAEEVLKMDFKDLNNQQSKTQRPQTEELKQSDWTKLNDPPKPSLFKCEKCDSDKIITHGLVSTRCDNLYTV